MAKLRGTQYDLTPEEAAVIDNLRMTPAERAAKAAEEAKAAEDILKARLKPADYAKIVAERQARAAMTPAERKAAMKKQLRDLADAIK